MSTRHSSFANSTRWIASLRPLVWAMAITLGGLARTPAQAAPPHLASAAPHFDLKKASAQFKVKRQAFAGGLAGYRYEVPNADGETLVIYRVVREQFPGIPRPTAHAAMLLPGDFSTVASNFAPAFDGEAEAAHPQLALALARANVDVWGVDRRYAQLADDTSDFASLADQGIVSGVDDLHDALGLARLIRWATSGSLARLKVIGFSRGGLYAYAHAITESSRHPWARHSDGIAVLDMHYVFGTAHEDQRLEACAIRDAYDAWIAQGNLAESNVWLRSVAEASIDNPSGPSDNDPELSNRQFFLLAMAQTYLFFAPTPHYHLLAAPESLPVLNELSYTSIDAAQRWVARAPAYASALEGRDSFAIWCADEQNPIAGTLADIRMPVLQIAVAGGYGDLVQASVDGVTHADSDLFFWEHQTPENRAIDLGHADLLFSTAARDEVWPTLTSWIKTH